MLRSPSYRVAHVVEVLLHHRPEVGHAVGYLLDSVHRLLLWVTGGKGSESGRELQAIPIAVFAFSPYLPRTNSAVSSLILRSNTVPIERRLSEEAAKKQRRW